MTVSRPLSSNCHNPVIRCEPASVMLIAQHLPPGYAMKLKTLVAVVTASLGCAVGTATAKIDPTLPDYKAASGVSGNFSSVGSDTLNNLMTLWAEEYKRLYPNVNIQIQGAGSSTAPPALTEGTANFGPMSRLMKDQEIQAFEQKYGYKPTGIGVAIDALAVFVNKDNPIKGLSIPQVDGIFSATRKGSFHGRITAPVPSRMRRPSTVPGTPADGFENDAMRMAAKTWTGEWWKHGGGGTVWDSMAYDAERGVPFDRYAATRIRGALLDELRSVDWASRSVRRALLDR
mgnify:CR=1 FL=1